MYSEKAKPNRNSKSLLNVNLKRPDIITNLSPNDNGSHSDLWSDAHEYHRRNETDIDLMEHSNSNIKTNKERKNKK